MYVPSMNVLMINYNNYFFKLQYCDNIEICINDKL